MDYDITENDEIANIYQKMVEGDKSALTQLQSVNAFSPKKKNMNIVERSISMKKSETQQHAPKTRKSQNFKSYVKQKVTELRQAKQSSKKQLAKPSIAKQKKQYRQSKPFSVQKKKNDPVSEKLVNVQTETKLPKASYKTQKISKTRTSNAFQQKMKKHIIKDKVSEPQKYSSPPSSKNSFRVRQIGNNNKKMIEQLMKINQQQRKVQAQILEIHNSTKQQIQNICQKYKIISLDKSRLSKISKNSRQNAERILTPPSPEHQGQAKNALSKISPFIRNQQNKISQIQKQLIAINSQLQNKKNQLSKTQAKIQMSALLQYINVVPDIFQERSSQQQNEQVSELPQKNNIVHDPTRTYHTVMNQRRKKNWGLHKRINYQGDIVKNESKISFISKQQNQNNVKINPLQQNTNNQLDNDNKIVVNSRLKQFLFD